MFADADGTSFGGRLIAASLRSVDVTDEVSRVRAQVLVQVDEGEGYHSGYFAGWAGAPLRVMSAQPALGECRHKYK